MTISLDTREDRKREELEAKRKPIPREPEAHSLAAQWTGLFLAPAVFFAHLQGAYLLVLWACERQGIEWIHAAAALAVIGSAAGAFVAWRVWSAAGRAADGDKPGTRPRARFIAECGLLLSAVITLILLAQLVSGFFISPCQ